jgi:hypothetical protein
MTSVPRLLATPTSGTLASRRTCRGRGSRMTTKVQASVEQTWSVTCRFTPSRRIAKQRKKCHIDLELRTAVQQAYFGTRAEV